MLDVRAEPVPDGTVVVRVAGEVDLTVTEELEQSLIAALRLPGARRVVVDLADLRFLDSSGVHALVKGYLAAMDAGLPYLVRSANGMVDRVLRLTGVAEAFGMPAEGDPSEYPKGA